MNFVLRFFLLIGAVILTAVMSPTANSESHVRPPWIDALNLRLKSELSARHGKPQETRIEQGLRQVARFWRESDGDAKAYENFVREEFVSDPAIYEEMFERFEANMEALLGHTHEIGRRFRRHTDLDLGDVRSFDRIFAGYSPGAHISEDLFLNRLAFISLLNFPLTTLEDRARSGARWTPRQWAETRLAGLFDDRVPASVNQEISRTLTDADLYISQYNIWMHHLLTEDGERLFPPGQFLLSHWDLRDEIKAQYKNPSPEEGLRRQRMIRTVMERIVTQTIPAVAVNNPHVDWKPESNTVTLSSVVDHDRGKPSNLLVSQDREPDTRFAMLRRVFGAMTLLDPYFPDTPTAIDRKFKREREMSEERVRGMLEEILDAPVFGRVVAAMRKDLNRPLEPSDIWYTGFQPGDLPEDRLTEITRKRYPTAEAFDRDIENLLIKLDFTEEDAAFLAAHIDSEPARGSGHASGGVLKGTKALLRARVGSEGMDYKGFNVACHELGHNVEQTLSLNRAQYWSLRGVPNTAFTEAVAFVFQRRTFELLDLPGPSKEERLRDVLHQYWQTSEIAAVSLVDMEAWRWMYANPGASPAEVRKAVLAAAENVWNRFYAKHFGVKDSPILAIYSHMIPYPLYLADYPLGFIISFQLEKHFEAKGSVGRELPRILTQGTVSPDLWMTRATGSPVSTKPFLAAVERALKN